MKIIYVDTRDSIRWSLTRTILYFRLFCSTPSEFVFFLLLSSKLSFIFAICSELAAPCFLPSDIFFLSIFIFFPFRRYRHSPIQTFFIIHRHFLCSPFLRPDSNYLLLFIPFLWNFFPFYFLPLSSKTKLRSKKNILTMVDRTFSSSDVKFRKTKRVNCVERPYNFNQR